MTRFLLIWSKINERWYFGMHMADALVAPAVFRLWNRTNEHLVTYLNNVSLFSGGWRIFSKTGKGIK